MRALITGITGQDASYLAEFLLDRKYEVHAAAFACAGLDWKKYVEIDSKLVRPAEVDYLCGDAAKARKTLGWKPDVAFHQLVEMMVEADLNGLRHSVASRTAAAGV